MRIQNGLLIGCATISAMLAACGGVSDCKEDGAKCAAMINANADKCALAFQSRQGDEKRKFCENAIKVVSQQKVKDAVPGLIAMLNVPESNSSDDHHRQEAAKALGKIGDTAAVDPLLNAIDLSAGTTSGEPRDKNANKSNEEIVTALGALKDKKALAKLIEVVDKTRDNYTQLKAVRALGKLGDPSAIDALSKIALESDNSYLRKNAIEALGDIGDPKATDTLIQMMFYEGKGVSFYREASFALFQIGPSVADALLKTMDGKNEKVNQYFEKTGGLKDTAIKAKCGTVLGDLRDSRAVKPLIEAFRAASKGDAKDPVVLVTAAIALGALGDPSAVPVLKEQFTNLDPSQREPILRALNQLGDRSVVPEMIKSMSKQWFVDTCVKEKIGSKADCASDDLKATLEGEQHAAADSASNLAGGEHLEEYKKIVEGEPDANMKKYFEARQARLDAAAECKAEGACWAGKLKSQDALIREKACWELGRIKDKNTVKALGDALGDPKPQSRSACIFAYWAYGDASVVPAIEKRLEDETSQADFIKVNEDLKRLLVHLKRKK